MRTTLAMAVLAVACLTSNANAVLMTLGTNEADYRALGANMAGKLLSISIQTQGVTGHGSAAYVNGYYAITSAHALVNSALTVPADLAIGVGTGPNYLSDPGVVVQGASVLVYPGYNGTFNTPDIAIVRFATPLSGPELTLGSAQPDDVVVAGGFGYPGFPGSNLSPQDGFSRGWQARVGTALATDVNDTYYNVAPFGSHKSGLTLNGRGTIGDSGGPWFNLAGELVGITDAGGGGTSTIGETYYLDLSNTEVRSWILANTVVPEPSALVLFATGAVAMSWRRRRRKKKSRRAIQKAQGGSLSFVVSEET